MRLRIVLTGAACSGKTTTLNALMERLKNDKSFRFVGEVATKYIQEQQKAGINPFDNLIQFERAMMVRQVKEEDAVYEDGTCSILDRSIIDDIAITVMMEVGIKEHLDIAGDFEKIAKGRNYNLVFVLDPLPFVKSSHRRQKDGGEALKEDKYIRDTYKKLSKELGFDVIYIPVMSVEARVDFIIREIKKLQARAQVSSSASVSDLGMFAAAAKQLHKLPDSRCTLRKGVKAQ